MSELFKDILFCINEQEEPTEEETPVKGEESEKNKEVDQGPEETPEEEEVTEEEQPIEDVEDTLTTIDQAYRLKKIYSKLIAISKLLDYHADNKFDDLRDKIIESIDLFHIIVNNFDSFQDKIDDIIRSFYRLLQSATEELERLSKIEK